MSYEFFQQINTVLPLAAFGWLAYRTRAAWPADWAKPHYVWHYRILLLIVLATVLLTSLAALSHESRADEATVVSLLYTLQTVAVLGLCYAWPLKRRSWRLAAQAAIIAEESAPHN